MRAQTPGLVGAVRAGQEVALIWVLGISGPRGVETAGSRTLHRLPGAQHSGEDTAARGLLWGRRGARAPPHFCSSHLGTRLFLERSTGHFCVVVLTGVTFHRLA